jgi:pheromone shutdown-related protein TraB
MPIERIHLDDKEIIIVGTAHISKSSVEETRQAIEEFKPDVVAIELCKNRYDVMRNPRSWQEMDIVKVIKEKKSLLLFANLIMSSIQRRMGDKFGVRPGEEMRAAIEEADKAGIPLAPVDRSVQVTLKRAWNSLSFWEKNKFLFSSLYSIIDMEEIKEEDIEGLKSKDMLTQAVEEIAKQAPTIKRVLIDERDAYMARKILDIEGKRVLAVVGAGHMEGLLGQIRNPIGDVAPLEEVPEKGNGLASWIIPIAVLTLVGAGFFHGSPKQGYEMIKWWIICSSSMAGLGAIVALAHPVTILVAAVSAPITTLNPALAAGWFAGLSEAYIKKPKVSDFESIHDDITRVRGWWTNPITRILLVVVLVNLGASVGVIAAMPILTRIFLHG